MTWEKIEAEPHTILVEKEDFEGFVCENLAAYEVCIYRFGLGTQGEKDWEWRNRVDATAEGIKMWLSEGWRRPVFRRPKKHYGKHDQSCKIIVELIGGVEKDG